MLNIPDFAQSTEELSFISGIICKYEQCLGAAMIAMVMEEYCLFHNLDIRDFARNLIAVVDDVVASEGPYCTNNE